MNLQTEKEKIQSLLKIPVSEIKFQPDYVEVFSGRNLIGGITYYLVSIINTYDTSDGIINRLRWDLVYQEHKNEIINQIKTLAGEDNLEITIGLFRKLYVKNKNGDILYTANCEFENGKWNVTLTSNKQL